MGPEGFFIRISVRARNEKVVELAGRGYSSLLTVNQLHHQHCPIFREAACFVPVIKCVSTVRVSVSKVRQSTQKNQPIVLS
jgi:hypothetical protein